MWDMWIKKYVPVPDDCKKAQEKKDATYFRSRSRRTRRSNRSRRRRCSPAARTVHRHTPSSGRCNRLLGRVPALVNSSKKTPLADGRAEVYSLEGLGVEIFKRGKRPKKNRSTNSIFFTLLPDSWFRKLQFENFSSKLFWFAYKADRLSALCAYVNCI